MKISITNSNRGLGLALSKRFEKSLLVKNVVDGFDESSDVFINNRHNSFKQTELLMEVFNKWKDTEKTIVNIVSRSKYPNISKGYMYSASKASLSHLSNNLRFVSDKKCRIIDINPGLLESELPSLSYEEIVDTIEYCINLPIHIEVGEISIWHKTPYNKISKLKDDNRKN
jgi:NADP-dependent 3-hydroxy acid dehydrogenase YdfG|tara:strand:- start:247 stop:759 length:513 start_codon:yes stop_codon:yes gene_type:complete